ncbi:MAG: hypothetical protein J6T15_03800 [Bacilli bacterium]|nr:hypothetical protein [Bacilli bacterium]
MMSVREYLALYLDKKKINKNDLVKKINRVEKELGESRTVYANVTNYLNGYHPFRCKVLAKWEVALGLEEGSLFNYVSPPLSSDGVKEFKDYLKKLREIRRKL